MQRGQRATYIDFEDTHKGLVDRLRSAGVTDQLIHDSFAYVNPDEPFIPFGQTSYDIGEHLAAWQPAVVVIDGVNAAMTLQGLDLNDNKDATLFAQHILKPMAEKTGTCVIYVDHVAKTTDENSRGGIGAQAKRAMTTGCCLRVEVIDAFGKGQNGKLRLRVDKDRQGDVRGASLPGKTGHWTGDILLLSNANDGTVDITFRSPDSTNAARAESAGTFRPTVLMERVSEYLEGAIEGASQRNIRTDVTGKADYIKAAIECLLADGYIAIAPRQGRGGGSVYVSVRAYRKALEGAAAGEVVPGSQSGSIRFPEPDGSGSPEPVPSLPPLQGEGTGSGTTSGRRDTADSGSGSRLVERSIAGERVLFDPATGEMYDPATGEVMGR
jgi:hypothetical protein